MHLFYLIETDYCQKTKVKICAVSLGGEEQCEESLQIIERMKTSLSQVLNKKQQQKKNSV